MSVAAEGNPGGVPRAAARLKVALGQVAAGADKRENLVALQRMVERAAGEGADLVIFPEAAMVAPGAPGGLVGYAEETSGPFVRGLAGVARAHGVTVVAGMFEPASSGRVFNTLVVLGREGGLLGRYRKSLLYDAFGYRESDQVEPGAGDQLTFELGGWRLGLLTCYEIRAPELALGLVRAGCDALVVPAAWVRGRLKEMHWEILLRARAVEGSLYVLGCGQPGTPYIGASMVVGPAGVVVAGAGEGEELVAAELDRSRLLRVRERLPPRVAPRTS